MPRALALALRVCSRYLFYRLHSHSDLKMLNRRRNWVDRIDDPMVTVAATTDMFNEIKNRHSSDGLAD